MSFGPATTADEVLAGVDLGGRVALVTGASGGIGRETARALAAAGATVILAARNRAKIDEAIAAILESTPGADVRAASLDLGSVERVRAFADGFLAEHKQLHLLVNNAGVMAMPALEHTTDGFELHFGTNHLGHFLLTCLVAPALVAGAPSRVVCVSSAGHRVSGIDWDDPHFARRPYDKWAAYGQSKTANALFAVELERRLGPRGVHAYAVHPGLVVTEIGRHLSREDIQEILDRAALAAGGRPTIKLPPAGAATVVWAATAPGLETRGGTYLADCAVSDDHEPYALDPEGARRLWSLSESLVGQEFPLHR